MDKIDQMDRHELNSALCFLQGRMNEEEKDYDDDENKPKSGKLNEKKTIKPKNIIKGKIEELENNVYHYGGKNVGDYYIKVTEAIADYVGREKGKEMKLLVLNRIESTPTEPPQPQVESGGTINPFVMEKYKMQLKTYLDEEKLYKKNKGIVFIVILGQCTLSMVNKLKSDSKFESIQQDDDVIKLMKMIKELCYVSTDARYEYWNLTFSLNKVTNVKQKDNETLAAYYKRFINIVDIVEGQWGTLAPLTIAEKDTDYQDATKKNGVIKACRNKYLACVFIKGCNWNMYGTCVNDLNNSYLSGQNNYPVSIEAAVNYLSNYMNDNGGSTKTKKEAHNFFQQQCYNCGELGFTKKTCPKCNKPVMM